MWERLWLRLKSGQAKFRLRSNREMANAIRKITESGEGLYQNHRGCSEIEKLKEVGKHFPVQVMVMIHRLKVKRQLYR